MIRDLLLSNIYLVMFIGLLLGGETTLLPAIYFGLTGTISLQTVICISLLATAISDTFWYFLGRAIRVERVVSLSTAEIFRRKAKPFANAFQEHGLVLLFLSKFVYGTRTIMQVLSGMNHVPFTKYFIVNISGILALNAFFIVLGLTVQESFAMLVASPDRLWLALGMFAITAVVLNLLFKSYIWKRIFR